MGVRKEAKEKWYHGGGQGDVGFGGVPGEVFDQRSGEKVKQTQRVEGGSVVEGEAHIAGRRILEP